ncbi:hypothetical protein GGR58DRAFT_50136 [Xylaria digitata]|nr:hypothetical protein GGR58DRAFT_50136 [Xylaria digitata]
MDKDTVIPLSCASSFHTESKYATKRPQFSNKPPSGFGGWPTIFEKPRGRNPGDGVHQMVLARAEDRKGTGSGINDAINHPDFMGYYNFDGRKFKELTKEEKRFLEFAVHYPNVRNGIMKAPLLFRTESFTQPTARQSGLVHKFFGTPELFHKIASHLISRYEDLVNLCRASQFTAGLVQSLWMHMDATTNDFLGWEMETLASVRMKEAQEEEEREKNSPKRFFSPTVIVSPVRPQDQGPPREVVRNKARYPVIPAVEKVKETDFGTSMCAHYKLLHMVYLNGHVIKHLILHGMPWVNVEAIQCIIPQMPILEALGIHQCFLMTLGDTQPLLHAINAINKEREEKENKQPHVALDFTPFYYRGPAYKPDGTGHVGEYGVVPEEMSWLHSTQAVTAQLIGIRHLCHKGGQDFFTSGTGFRSFLNRLPIRTMESILQCIEKLQEYKNGTYNPTSKEMKHQMEVTLWQDIIISCNGRPMLKGDLEKLIISRGEVKLSHCVECDMEMAAYFFQANILARRAEYILCHGCQLQIRLTSHHWRAYNLRRYLAIRIFKGRSKKPYLLRKVLNHINKPGTPKREAITCRPGMVDEKFLEHAQKLWEQHTYEIPGKIRGKGKKIARINKQYDSLPEEEKERVWQIKADLEKERLSLEFNLGTNQRDRYNGSLERPCRSWELNIRDFRAELAIENSRFSNNGPMTMWNLESNAASMLGRSGGLHEYWNDDADDEEPADELMTKDGHDEVPTSQERASSQAGFVPPHKRTTRQVAAPAVQAPLIPPSGQACSSSVPPPPPHKRPAQSVSQQSHLLPYQRRGPQVVPAPQSTSQEKISYVGSAPSHKDLVITTGQATQNIPPNKRPAQTVAQQAQQQHLLPHQWPGPKGGQAGQNILAKAQSTPTASSPSSVPPVEYSSQGGGLALSTVLPHRRRPMEQASGQNRILRIVRTPRASVTSSSENSPPHGLPRGLGTSTESC